MAEAADVEPMLPFGGEPRADDAGKGTLTRSAAGGRAGPEPSRGRSAASPPAPRAGGQGQATTTSLSGLRPLAIAEIWPNQASARSGAAQQSTTPRDDLPPMAAGQWRKGELIGRGTCACVYQATDRQTGALCAMKELDIIPYDAPSAQALKKLHKEINFLSQFKHENIVRYYGSEIIEDQLCIYVDYVHPGSIKKHYGAMAESVIRRITRHILNGLVFLHSNNIMHRNIKGANLLVDVNGVVKLADFGMAQHLTTAAPYLSLKDPYWMAPEAVQAMLVQNVDNDLAIDIWSLGCTVIEMFTGEPPWSNLEGPAAIFKVAHKDPPIPDTLSVEGKDFLRWCFKRDPIQRPTASMFIRHPFIQNSFVGMEFENRQQGEQMESLLPTLPCKALSMLDFPSSSVNKYDGPTLDCTVPTPSSYGIFSDNYGFNQDVNRELSADDQIKGSSRLQYHYTVENIQLHHNAAILIQKRFRGWKQHKKFAGVIKCVAKIQAHVRGHQVRKCCRTYGSIDAFEKAAQRYFAKRIRLRGSLMTIIPIEDQNVDFSEMRNRSRKNQTGHRTA